ncbi:MAG: hypothetical protein GX620_07610 [Chloroflexi bacterium]|nr:hypothetical protein [Chloroflexota bacterium]
MKEGPKGGMLRVLSDSDVEQIHSASLALLARHGMYSESDAILDIFRDGGADVDLRSRIVRLPRDLVDWALSSAPERVVLYGRDPAMDLLLEPGRVYFGMGGSSEPFIWDYEARAPREPTKADMVANTRVGQAASNVDFVMALCSAGDVPDDEIYLHEYDALLRNTTKPVIYSAPGEMFTRWFFEMAAAASGGEAEFRQRPCVVHWTQPISPMQIGAYTEGAVVAAELGVPIMFSPGPMMGATSPATLAGTLAQVNAEALAGIVLAQIIRPGTPVIYAPHTGVMDMRTAQCTYGSPEQSLARAAVAQIGIHYRLPSFGLGGGVEAKLPDSEAAAQAMMGMLMNGLSGLTLTQTLGTLASGLYGSPEMLLICDEIAHMVKRILAGLSVSDDTLAVGVIEEVGHGGHFLEHEHTLRHFRNELFFPFLFQRQSIDEWIGQGSRPVDQIAHERVTHVLASAAPIELPSGANQSLTEVLCRAVADVRSRSRG